MKAPPGEAVTGHPDSVLAAIASRHPIVGLALGVVRDGRLCHFHGHGLADIASRTPVTEDTAFRIGSSTKTFTAIAVLQLCEQGLIDLDAPAGDYLRAYRLIPAKPGHRTVLAINVLGLPAVALPVGTADGLPQSVQVIGPRYREDLCLDAAAAIEHRLGILTPIDLR